MSNQLMYVPIIDGGNDLTYKTVETVSDFRREPLLRVPLGAPYYVSKAAERARKGAISLRREYTINNILDIFQRAANIFEHDDVSLGDIAVSSEEHIKLVVRSTGLPYSSVKKSLHDLGMVMRGMRQMLEAQTPRRNLSMYDGLDHYRPKGDILGVILPGNHPTVNALWLVALAAKYTIVARPSNDDVLTSYRLIRSLYMAGLPRDTIFFIPGDHSLVPCVLGESDRSIIFGNEDTITRYKNDTSVLGYGPGRSKSYDDLLTLQTVSTHVRAMMEDGGRGCINTSAFITPPRKSNWLANEIWKKIRGYKPLDPLDPASVIPAVKSEEMARGISLYIDSQINGGNELGRGIFGRNRVVEAHGTHFLMPTLVRTPDYKHRLFGVELPFQFATVTEVDEKDLSNALGDSLVISLFTKNIELINRVKKLSSVGGVNIGTTTLDINPENLPHGNLIAHLYEI